MCKHGFPKANVFDWAAMQVLKFEKKKKAENAKKLESLRHSKDIKDLIEKKIRENEVRDRLTGLVI